MIASLSLKGEEVSRMDMQKLKQAYETFMKNKPRKEEKDIPSESVLRPKNVSKNVKTG